MFIYKHKSSVDVHELQRRFFIAKIQPEQSLADYIGELQRILSELTDIGIYAYTTMSDGSLDRFKARLVAKGCSQTPGTDMELHQFDITTTFLNALLHTVLYMHQVPRYVDVLWKHLVCYLKKALYGLRQASRQLMEPLH